VNWHQIKKLVIAIVLKLIKQFNKSSSTNAFDSLAETYGELKENELAIQN
jgi:hypothetical protein